MKAPAEHEPVIPSWADTVIALAGLDCIGGTIAQVCHRPEKVCALLGEEESHLVTPEDAAEVLLSAQGGVRMWACALSAVY